MLNINMKGFKEVEQKLKDLQKRASALQGTKNVPVSELLTKEFLGKHSRFASVEEFFSNSGFQIDSPEDFKKIPDAEWDAYIARSTNFKSWSEMLKAASAEWVSRQLGLK